MMEGIQGAVAGTVGILSQEKTEGRASTSVGTDTKNAKDSITISTEGKAFDWKVKGDRFYAYMNLTKDYRLEDEVKSLFEGYYAGKTPIEVITQEFDYVVQTIRDYEEQEGIASKADMEHFAKLVSDVHREFKMYSVETAVLANDDEGRDLANQYGTPGRKNFLYYNSDYYFQSEDINQAFFQRANEMLEGTGFPLNTAPVKHDIYENFNTYWKDSALCSSRMGDMIDTDMEPPRGFTFLYKEDRYTEPERDALIAQHGGDYPHLFDGILKVSCGSWKTEGNVTLGYGPNAALGNNALELLNRFSEASDSRIARFLGNINIHQVFYGTDYLYRLGWIG